MVLFLGRASFFSLNIVAFHIQRRFHEGVVAKARHLINIVQYLAKFNSSQEATALELSLRLTEQIKMYL
jgi:hypothetical protein